MLRLVLPPTHVLALVEFQEAAAARAAFASLAYRRLRGSPMYLEWAPASIWGPPFKVHTPPRSCLPPLTLCSCMRVSASRFCNLRNACIWGGPFKVHTPPALASCPSSFAPACARLHAVREDPGLQASSAISVMHMHLQTVWYT